MTSINTTAVLTISSFTCWKDLRAVLGNAQPKCYIGDVRVGGISMQYHTESGHPRMAFCPVDVWHVNQGTVEDSVWMHLNDEGKDTHFQAWELHAKEGELHAVGVLNPKGRAAFLSQIKACDNAAHGIDNIQRLGNARNKRIPLQ